MQLGWCRRGKYLFVFVGPGLLVGFPELLGLQAVLARSPGSSVGIGELGRGLRRRGAFRVLRGMLGTGFLGCHVVRRVGGG